MMNRRWTRIWVWLSMFLAGATVFQTGGFTTRNGAISGGCSDFWINGAATSVDFCYLLDCENGFFGGLIQPCDPNNPLLVDCTPAGGDTDDDEEQDEEEEEDQ
ncbi:MAG: hypothetical protein GXY55_07755 [Phycisphaerae bacterium]|nr:hypothetical protein [Phycisphaerae bacterium]